MKNNSNIKSFQQTISKRSDFNKLKIIQKITQLFTEQQDKFPF